MSQKEEATATSPKHEWSRYLRRNQAEAKVCIPGTPRSQGVTPLRGNRWAIGPHLPPWKKQASKEHQQAMLKIQLRLSVILQFPNYDKSRHNFAIAQFSSKDSAISHPCSARTLPHLPPRPTSLARAFPLSLSLSLHCSSAILGLGFQQIFHPSFRKRFCFGWNCCCRPHWQFEGGIAKSQTNYRNLKVWLCLAWAPLPFQPWALLPLKPWAWPYIKKFVLLLVASVGQLSLS